MSYINVLCGEEHVPRLMLDYSSYRRSLQLLMNAGCPDDRGGDVGKSVAVMRELGRDNGDKDKVKQSLQTGQACRVDLITQTQG